MQSCSSVAAGSGVGSLHQPAFFRAEGTGYHLMAAGMFGGNDTGTTPGGTVVGAGSHHHGQSLPGSGSFYTIHVDQCAVIVQE